MSSSQRRTTMRIPPFFRRLFKFTSMDFETVSAHHSDSSHLGRKTDSSEQAVWEMTHLIIAPKKVFRNIYYHVRSSPRSKLELSWSLYTDDPSQKQTKSTYHRPDPAFTYLLSLFLFMTGLAWGLAYTTGFGPIRVALAFVLGHFLATSLLVSTLMYFLVGRVLGKRRQGLFGPSPTGGGEEGLEFGYCFDVGWKVGEEVERCMLIFSANRWRSGRIFRYGSSFTSSNFSSCP